MTNREIIQEVLTLSGAKINQEDLKTYAVWKAEGYQVRKGEKAILQLDLWIPIKYKKGEENKEVEADGDKQDGFRKRKSSLFHRSQVDLIEE